MASLHRGAPDEPSQPSDPAGLPPDRRAGADNFKLVETPVPTELAEGQVLVRNHYLSLDPYMRGRMNDGKSYATPQPLNEVMIGGTVGEWWRPRTRTSRSATRWWAWAAGRSFPAGRRQPARRAAEGRHHARAAVALPRSSTRSRARPSWSAPPAARSAVRSASWPRPAARARWALPAAPTNAATSWTRWALTPASTTSSTRTRSPCPRRSRPTAPRHRRLLRERRRLHRQRAHGGVARGAGRARRAGGQRQAQAARVDRAGHRGRARSLPGAAQGPQLRQAAGQADLMAGPRWTCQRFDDLSVRGLYPRCGCGPRSSSSSSAASIWIPTGWTSTPGICKELGQGLGQGADGGDTLLAYARLLPPEIGDGAARIGRVITAPTARGGGLGRALMSQAVRECQRLWPGQPIELGAQAHLREFYGSFGFTPSPTSTRGRDPPHRHAQGALAMSASSSASTSGAASASAVTADDLVLHHYAGSPFAEKARLMLGFKGLAWHSVTVPMILPKPDVAALTGGYRRTPFLQIGADIYCDTTLIAEVLEGRRPTPSLFPGGGGGPGAAAVAMGRHDLFWTALPYSMHPAGAAAMFAGAPPEVLQAFVADRKAMTEGMPQPRGGTRPRR
ncbi:acetyltransferase (GNAT) domain-containing protein [Ditylenchus destructor]|nr:acetyltransferase (GNAT) domain-containing protein [Ditylenchus destructor]